MSATNTAPDFWRASGHHLLDRDADGALLVTDDFLKAYLARPEIAPVPESGPRERALHETLLATPRHAIASAELAAIEDGDARENYEIWLAFRDRLIERGTVEAAYVSLFQKPLPRLPGLFLDHLAALILRRALDGTTDPQRARAAELFFRGQKATLQEGAVLLADEETVDMLATTRGLGSLGQLIVEAGGPAASVEMDILTDANGALYWERSDRHDMVLDLTFTRPGLDAFARALEAWVGVLLGAEVAVEPVRQIRDERWVWHVGLDVEASAIMNALYRGEDVEEDRLRRILALFRLEFRDPALMLARVAGRPVYLGLAMDESNRVRMKPQNLVVNLPIEKRS
jgi:hypothetical protein